MDKNIEVDEAPHLDETLKETMDTTPQEHQEAALDFIKKEPSVGDLPRNACDYETDQSIGEVPKSDSQSIQVVVMDTENTPDWDESSMYGLVSASLVLEDGVKSRGSKKDEKELIHMEVINSKSRMTQASLSSSVLSSVKSDENLVGISKADKKVCIDSVSEKITLNNNGNEGEDHIPVHMGCSEIKCKVKSPELLEIEIAQNQPTVLSKELLEVDVSDTKCEIVSAETESVLFKNSEKNHSNVFKYNPRTPDQVASKATKDNTQPKKSTRKGQYTLETVNSRSRTSSKSDKILFQYREGDLVNYSCVGSKDFAGQCILADAESKEVHLNMTPGVEVLLNTALTANDEENSPFSREGSLLQKQATLDSLIACASMRSKMRSCTRCNQQIEKEPEIETTTPPPKTSIHNIHHSDLHPIYLSKKGESHNIEIVKPSASSFVTEKLKIVLGSNQNKKHHLREFDTHTRLQSIGGIRHSDPALGGIVQSGNDQKKHQPKTLSLVLAHQKNGSADPLFCLSTKNLLSSKVSIKSFEEEQIDELRETVTTLIKDVNNLPSAEVLNESQTDGKVSVIAYEQKVLHDPMSTKTYPRLTSSGKLSTKTKPKISIKHSLEFRRKKKTCTSESGNKEPKGKKAKDSKSMPAPPCVKSIIQNEKPSSTKTPSNTPVSSSPMGNAVPLETSSDIDVEDVPIFVRASPTSPADMTAPTITNTAPDGAVATSKSSSLILSPKDMKDDSSGSTSLRESLCLLISPTDSDSETAPLMKSVPETSEADNIRNNVSFDEIKMDDETSSPTVEANSSTEIFPFSPELYKDVFGSDIVLDIRKNNPSKSAEYKCLDKRFTNLKGPKKRSKDISSGFVTHTCSSSEPLSDSLSEIIALDDQSAQDVILDYKKDTKCELLSERSSYENAAFENFNQPYHKTQTWLLSNGKTGTVQKSASVISRERPHPHTPLKYDIGVCGNEITSKDEGKALYKTSSDEIRKNASWTDSVIEGAKVCLDEKGPEDDTQTGTGNDDYESGTSDSFTSAPDIVKPRVESHEEESETTDSQDTETEESEITDSQGTETEESSTYDEGVKGGYFRNIITVTNSQHLCWLKQEMEKSKRLEISSEESTDTDTTPGEEDRKEAQHIPSEVLVKNLTKATQDIKYTMTPAQKEDMDLVEKILEDVMKAKKGQKPSELSPMTDLSGEVSTDDDVVDSRILVDLGSASSTTLKEETPAVELIKDGTTNLTAQNSTSTTTLRADSLDLIVKPKQKSNESVSSRRSYSPRASQRGRKSNESVSGRSSKSGIQTHRVGSSSSTRSCNNTVFSVFGNLVTRSQHVIWIEPEEDSCVQQSTNKPLTGSKSLQEEITPGGELKEIDRSNILSFGNIVTVANPQHMSWIKKDSTETDTTTVPSSGAKETLNNEKDSEISDKLNIQEDPGIADGIQVASHTPSFSKVVSVTNSQHLDWLQKEEIPKGDNQESSEKESEMVAPSPGDIVTVANSQHLGWLQNNSDEIEKTIERNEITNSEVKVKKKSVEPLFSDIVSVTNAQHLGWLKKNTEDMNTTDSKDYRTSLGETFRDKTEFTIETDKCHKDPPVNDGDIVTVANSKHLMWLQDNTAQTGLDGGEREPVCEDKTGDETGEAVLESVDTVQEITDSIGDEDNDERDILDILRQLQVDGVAKLVDADSNEISFNNMITVKQSQNLKWLTEEEVIVNDMDMAIKSSEEPSGTVDSAAICNAITDTYLMELGNDVDSVDDHDDANLMEKSTIPSFSKLVTVKNSQHLNWVKKEEEKNDIGMTDNDGRPCDSVEVNEDPKKSDKTGKEGTKIEQDAKVTKKKTKKTKKTKSEMKRLSQEKITKSQVPSFSSLVTVKNSNHLCWLQKDEEAMLSMERSGQSDRKKGTRNDEVGQEAMSLLVEDSRKPPRSRQAAREVVLYPKFISLKSPKDQVIEKNETEDINKAVKSEGHAVAPCNVPGNKDSERSPGEIPSYQKWMNRPLSMIKTAFSNGSSLKENETKVKEANIENNLEKCQSEPKHKRLSKVEKQEIECEAWNTIHQCWKPILVKGMADMTGQSLSNFEGISSVNNDIMESEMFVPHKELEKKKSREALSLLENEIFKNIEKKGSTLTFQPTPKQGKEDYHWPSAPHLIDKEEAGLVVDVTTDAMSVFKEALHQIYSAEKISQYKNEQSLKGEDIDPEVIRLISQEATEKLTQQEKEPEEKRTQKIISPEETAGRKGKGPPGKWKSTKKREQPPKGGAVQGSQLADDKPMTDFKNMSAKIDNLAGSMKYDTNDLTQKSVFYSVMDWIQNVKHEKPKEQSKSEEKFSRVMAKMGTQLEHPGQECVDLTVSDTCCALMEKNKLDGSYQESPDLDVSLVEADAITCMIRPAIKHEPFPKRSYKLSPLANTSLKEVKCADISPHTKCSPEMEEMAEAMQYETRMENNEKKRNRTPRSYVCDKEGIVSNSVGCLKAHTVKTTDSTATEKHIYEEGIVRNEQPFCFDIKGDSHNKNVFCPIKSPEKVPGLCPAIEENIEMDYSKEGTKSDRTKDGTDSKSKGKITDDKSINKNQKKTEDILVVEHDYTTSRVIEPIIEKEECNKGKAPRMDNLLDKESEERLNNYCRKALARESDILMSLAEFSAMVDIGLTDVGSKKEAADEDKTPVEEDEIVAEKNIRHTDVGDAGQIVLKILQERIKSSEIFEDFANVTEEELVKLERKISDNDLKEEGRRMQAKEPDTTDSCPQFSPEQVRSQDKRKSPIRRSPIKSPPGYGLAVVKKSDASCPALNAPFDIGLGTIPENVGGNLDGVKPEKYTKEQSVPFGGQSSKDQSDFTESERPSGELVESDDSTDVNEDEAKGMQSSDNASKDLPLDVPDEMEGREPGPTAEEIQAHFQYVSFLKEMFDEVKDSCVTMRFSSNPTSPDEVIDKEAGPVDLTSGLASDGNTIDGYSSDQTSEGAQEPFSRSITAAVSHDELECSIATPKVDSSGVENDEEPPLDFLEEWTRTFC